MTGSPRFDPRELDEAGLTDAELAETLLAARALERLGTDDPAPSSGFAERVMAAVALEPDPRPMAAAASAVRQVRPAGVVAALRDAWRTTFGGGRPIALRAQAAALLLVAALAIGSTGGLVVAGGMALLGPDRDAAPSPVVSPEPTAEPSPSPSPSVERSPSPSPSPSPSAEPSASPEQSEAAEPSETPDGSEAVEPTGSPEPTDTAEPDDTPKPGDTPRPSDTPDPEDTPDPTD